MHAGRVSFQVRLRSWLTVTIFRAQIGCKILVSVEHELQASILLVRRSPPVPSSFDYGRPGRRILTYQIRFQLRQRSALVAMAS